MFRNASTKIQAVIETVGCTRHAAERLKPCWWTKQNTSSKISFAVCDARARDAGFNAPISDKSLRLNHFKKQENRA
jgi:hypothetical protein